MYLGRFAPSPTGPLHFGSLVAALASFLDARAHQGRWLVRNEDVDRPRAVAGAMDTILATLAAYGLEWDGPVITQSDRDDAYQAALNQLRAAGQVFFCNCPRKRVAGRVYDGHCRGNTEAGRSIRVRVEDRVMVLDDATQGRGQWDLARAIGDFIIRRGDGLFAYQLAVVVDDAEQGITHIVRGADLIDSTPRQQYLQSLLNLPKPAYRHIPVVASEPGKKLSKQHFAPAIPAEYDGACFRQALAFLGQSPPEAVARVPRDEALAWALRNWQADRVPRLPERVWPRTGVKIA